jgi:hypothetical protein
VAALRSETVQSPPVSIAGHQTSSISKRCTRSKVEVTLPRLWRLCHPLLRRLRAAVMKKQDPGLRYGGALGGTRTPNLLIRSQMLYPLSYERRCRTVYGTNAYSAPPSAATRSCIHRTWWDGLDDG